MIDNIFNFIYKYFSADATSKNSMEPELIAESGQVFVTFYSDRAVVGGGFNISFTSFDVNQDCNLNCKNGTCIS